MAWLFLSVGPAPAQDLPGDYRIRARTVPAGERTRIWTSWSIDKDCSVIRGFNLRVSRPPSLGTASLEKVERTIDESFLSSDIQPGQRRNARRCLGRSVLTIAVFYQAPAGASGADSLSFVITNARQTRQRVIDLNIRIR